MTKPRSHEILRPDENGRLAYRLKEVAAMTGVPVSTLRTRIRSGDLNPVIGLGPWLISADELRRILERRLRNSA